MKKLKVSHKGRVCRRHNCRIILSIYNHGDYCYMHQDRMLFVEQSKNNKFAKVS